jgi:hypothetical protein
MEQEVANKLVAVMVVSPFLFIFYVPITWIAYRNAPFRTPLRITFSLAVVPLFIFLMYHNYSFVSDYFPRVVGSFEAVSAARPSGKGTSMLAALITCPLAAFGCFLWYKIHYFLDRKILGGKEPKPLNKSEQQIRFFNTVWMAIFVVSLLLSFMLTVGISQILDPKLPL